MKYLTHYFIYFNSLYGGIIDYLKGVMKRDERWIIPGIEALDLEFFNLLRRKKKKGLMWEMKKYINYIK